MKSLSLSKQRTKWVARAIFTFPLLLTTNGLSSELEKYLGNEWQRRTEQAQKEQKEFNAAYLAAKAQRETLNSINLDIINKSRKLKADTDRLKNFLKEKINLQIATIEKQVNQLEKDSSSVEILRLQIQETVRRLSFVRASAQNFQSDVILLKALTLGLQEEQRVFLEWKDFVQREKQYQTNFDVVGLLDSQTDSNKMIQSVIEITSRLETALSAQQFMDNLYVFEGLEKYLQNRSVIIAQVLQSLKRMKDSYQRVYVAI